MKIERENERPGYCQFKDSARFNSNFGRCQHIEHLPVKEVPGSSGFCLGKIEPDSFEIDGVDHDNDFCLCIYAPNREEMEFQIVSLLINRVDMRIFKRLADRALATRGHMKEDENE